MANGILRPPDARGGGGMEDASFPRAYSPAAPPQPPSQPSSAGRLNATALLGDRPATSGSVDPRSAGTAGVAVHSVAQIMQGIQGLASVAPGFVPPPVAAWVENLMQQIPQWLQQRTSLQFTGNGGGGATPMPMPNSMQQQQQQSSAAA